MLAGASGTAHTLAQRGDERAPAQTRTCFPTIRRRAAATSDFDDHDPLESEPPPPSAEPVVVPRWIQLVALPLLLLLGFAVIKAAGPVVLLFVTAAVIALILNPLVAGLQRAHLPRGVAIVCVYLGFVAALVAAGVLLANPISDQVTTLRDDIPSITDSANQRLADVQDYFDRKGINVEIKKQGQTALETLQEKVVGGTDSIVSFGTDLLTKLVTAGFGLILVFVLSIYMLIHGERIGALVRGVMPPGDGTREDDYPSRVVRAVAGYVRGQLLFSVVDGRGRRHRAVDLRRRRDLPRRQDLRAGLRGVVRAHGARARTSARSWAPCRRCSWRSSRTR